MSPLDSSDPSVRIRIPSDPVGPRAQSRGRAALRRIALAAGILFALLLAVTLIFAIRFRSLLDPENLAASLEPRISRAVNRPVTIDGASLRLWPRPGVRVEGIRVANRGVFSETALASADGVLLEPRLWPLLRRQVVIDRIVVRSPRLLLIVDEDGTTNFGDFVPEPEEEGASPATRAGGLALDVHRLELVDGRAGYRDAMRSRGVQLDGVNLATDLERSGGGVILTEGTAEAASVTLRHPGVREGGLQATDASIRWAGSVSLDSSFVNLTRADVEAGAFRAQISGRIDSLNRPIRPLRLTLRAEGLSLADLVGRLESGYRPTGVVELDLRLSGAAGPGLTPEASGLVTLRGGTIDSEDGRSLVTRLDADATIAAGSAELEAAGRFLDGDLSVTGHIGLDSLLAYELQVGLEAGLEDLLTLAPAGSGGRGSAREPPTGRLTLAAAATGQASAGGAPTLDGTATITDLRASLDPLTEPIRAASVPIRLIGDEATWNKVGFEVGASRGTTSGRAGNLFGAEESRDDRPTVDASIRFDRLDLDEVLPERSDDGIGWGRLVSARLGNRQFEGLTAEQLAVERGQARPAVPPFSGDLHLEIGSLLYSGSEITDIDGRIRFGRQNIEMSRLDFRAYGGTGTATGLLELGSAYVEPFGLRLDLQGVRAEEWLSRQTPLGRYVSGTMGIELELAGGLDSLLLPDAASLAGSGAIRVRDGALAPSPLTRAIASVVGAADPTGGRLQSWVSRFRIGDAAVQLSDGRFEFPKGQADLAGGVGFNGDLDLALRLRPDPATVRDLGEPYLSSVPPAVRAALAGGGSPELALRVGGRIGSPQVSVDPESVRRAQEAVIDAGRTEIEKRGLDLLRRLTGQKDSVDASPAAPDTAGDVTGEQQR